MSGLQLSVLGVYVFIVALSTVEVGHCVPGHGVQVLATVHRLVVIHIEVCNCLLKVCFFWTVFCWLVLVLALALRLLLRDLPVDALTCRRGSFIKLNIVELDLSDVRIGHVFIVFYFLSDPNLMLAAVDVFIVVLDVHRAQEGNVLPTCDQQFPSASPGVDVCIRLVSRCGVLSSNACLELVLSVDAGDQLL